MDQSFDQATTSKAIFVFENAHFRTYDCDDDIQKKRHTWLFVSSESEHPTVWAHFEKKNNGQEKWEWRFALSETRCVPCWGQTLLQLSELSYILMTGSGQFGYFVPRSLTQIIILSTYTQCWRPLIPCNARMVNEFSRVQMISVVKPTRREICLI